MNHRICDLDATKEWLRLDSIDYIVECLEACENFEMLVDLREIFPRQTLKVAITKVGASQRERIITKLQQFNQLKAA
ncbi:hypothetical protein H6G97_49960 [Nostoc flagelliforme FACHB-838]|uniref:Uncharacterized protein n=1 Tax=Nostoc flagelliforme FACHB-838 TaxID=2692904 RepID=A0ABR8E679_9NOSO|nr:hypothetical protein [Nostoc flagelliforme]MBD2536913.1 hypothetical protein [Nostoc flagelliforme FACHB-838]